MKTLMPLSERGQALVMIALAAIGLFALTALAIDGSAIFSDRRHAQNAADTGVLQAALTKIRNPTDLTAWEYDGLKRVKSNGYDNNGISNDVLFYNPPIDGPYAGNSQYIQVKIRSDVKLFFARIVGWQMFTNNVQAVARASVPEVTTWFDGQALVSTMPGCKNDLGWNHDPFTVNGNSGTTVVNSGIFVNAQCDNAYDQGGSSWVVTDKGVCVVGSADYTNTSPHPTEDCTQKNPSLYTLPNPDCGTQVGKIDKISTGNYVAFPGKYSGTFPDDALPNGSPAGTLKLEKGIYCFEHGINFQSTWDVTTNVNGNVNADGKDIHDPDSEGVFLFVEHGDVTLNGSSHFYLHAVSSLYGNFPKELLNYLIYVPDSNHATIKITGDNGSTFTGTILAPHSHVVLNGGTGTVGLDTQIIGYSVAIEGNGTLDIQFNQSNNGMTMYQPAASLSQ